MWETTELDVFEFSSNLGASTGMREMQIRGIPHLAKNERDVGHPAFTPSVTE